MKLFKKGAQLLHEHLPGKKWVYFIYTHKNGYERFNNGLTANTELSYWNYRALRAHFPRVRFLRLHDEKPERIEQITENDVVVGHIGPTYEQASRRTKKLIAFNPWCGDPDCSQEKFNCSPKEWEISCYDRAQALILLTSEFNTRKYIETPTNDWFDYLQTKRVRVVHQPIDLKVFKRIKWEYKTNDFLYIGNDAHMKRVGEAKRLVAQTGRTLHIYGFNGKTIDHRNRSEVDKLPQLADFFIQPGLWEAQCVSILEAAARGFIPVVTPETGYPYSHPFLLKPRDFDYNAQILKDLLQTTAEERKQLADDLHGRLARDIEHNTWSRLTDVVVEEVARLF